MRYLLSILIILSLLSCSKDDSQQTKEDELNSKNFNGLFIGSTLDGKQYNIRIINKEGGITTGTIQGRKNNKSLSNCEYDGNRNFGAKFQLNPGTYNVEATDLSISGKDPLQFKIDIVSGKCLSLNIEGNAW